MLDISRRVSLQRDFLSIVCLRPHSLILQTSQNTEEFIMSGYHHARHTVKLASTLVQTQWLSLDVARSDSSNEIKSKAGVRTRRDVLSTKIKTLDGVGVQLGIDNQSGEKHRRGKELKGKSSHKKNG